MKSFIALVIAGSLTTIFASCEKHSWEGSTKKLFEEHGGDHAKHEGEDKHKDEGEHGKSDKDH